MTENDKAVWTGLFQRTFPEVDPAFSQHLRRLIHHAPHLINCLHAGDCRVERFSYRSALDVLHRSRISAPESWEIFRAELNSGRHPAESEKATRLILEEADRRWNELDDNMRLTILALPIHRTPKGEFISLVDPDGSGKDLVNERFRLQSEDDLHDAPIELPDYELLHSKDRWSYRFYRGQLQLEEHGSVAVLKECLRRIGEADDERTNRTLLEYIAKYYRYECGRLARGDAVAQSDAAELQDLFECAKTVPCTDGQWRNASECLSAWDVAKTLRSQGGRGDIVDTLVGHLAFPIPVATVDSSLRSLIQPLHQLPRLEPHDISKLAIKSESPDFDLQMRVALIADNLEQLPRGQIDRAAVLDGTMCRALGGQRQLDSLEWVDTSDLDLRKSILQRFFPDAADVDASVTEFEISAENVENVFVDALGVPRLSQTEINYRIVEKFDDLWPDLGETERLNLLAYVGQQNLTSRLASPIRNLDVIRVGNKKSEWRSPAAVLSPRWEKTQPPHLADEQHPNTEGVDPQVLLVWERWCGLNELKRVVHAVIAATHAIPDIVPGSKQMNAWKALKVWLTRIHAQEDVTTADLVAALENQQWVLTRKGDERKFHKASAAIFHPGASVLAHAFWVVEGDLPPFVRESPPDYDILSSPPATPDSMGHLADCLSTAITVSSVVVRSVYQLVVDVIQQESSLRRAWQEQAQEKAVYRLFRTPERYVTRHELFIGNEDIQSDFGEWLWCLKANDCIDSQVIELYQHLGIDETPSVEQIIGALSGLEGTSTEVKAIHEQLVGILTTFSIEECRLNTEAIREIRVLACLGTYEPIHRCYWTDELGRPERLTEQSRIFVIDRRDKPTQQIIKWLENGLTDGVKSLTDLGHAELMTPPGQVDVAPSLLTIFEPWEEWFSQLESDGTILREDANERFGVVLPKIPFDFVAVNWIPIRYVLPDSTVIEPSEAWEGPEIFQDGRSPIFLRKDWLEQHTPDRPDRLEAFDKKVGKQVFNLLQSHAQNQLDQETFLEFVSQTLERPNVFLNRVREENQGSIFAQYRDQAVNSEFEALFSEYRRLSDRATVKREELKEKMRAIVHEDFVQKRREQIRGYGYDAFSVFAEMVQNAEDAYAQRAVLGLDESPQRSIAFRYCFDSDGTKHLVVEHFGRLFNQWQHGSRREGSFKGDIEGVLRSSGSFKPYASRENGVGGPIGRFGLGFKSVYLITNRPRIHSGQWHFEIESGCLPKPIPSPEMPTGATRIQLQLIENESEERDETGERLINLIPFLRQIGEISLQNADGTNLSLQVSKIETALCADETLQVERVEIQGVKHVQDGVVHLLRLRSSVHDGQLALYLNSTGMPARWDEAFNRDTFVVLPLQMNLGCGVGVSHLFELQSGRTHLINLEGNQPRFDQIAHLIRGIASALQTCVDANRPLGEVMMSFWQLWRWNRSDSEVQTLQQSLAKELVALAQTSSIVPTKDVETCVALGENTVFCFTKIPAAFEDELIRQEIEVDVANQAMSLRADHVVLRPFLSCYRQACHAAGYSQALNPPQQIGWKDIGVAFQKRAWLAEQPHLLSAMARTIPAEDFEPMAEWLKNCKLRAIDENGTEIHEVARNLFAPSFPGAQHLPDCKMRRLHGVYDSHAIDLLKRVGLNVAPADDQLRRWVTDGLNRTDCIGILRYLAEGGRWYRHFYELKEFLSQHRWFAGGSGSLILTEAFQQGLIPDDILTDSTFKTWLGIVSEAEAEEIEPERTDSVDPSEILKEIYDWWHQEGKQIIKSEYEQRLYPDGHSPQIGSEFFERDSCDRKQWLMLLLLACSHTMGRTTFEQHRGFLHLCDHRGWLDVFADPVLSADDWLRVLDEYLDEQIQDSPYHEWVKQFVTIYQLARWLPEYVEGFLDINKRGEQFRRLDQITVPLTDEVGGFDAPPIARALGMGACFVLRELVRKTIIRSPHAYPHCYVPAQRVRNCFNRLGCNNLTDDADNILKSREIHKFLTEHLGDEKATFDLSFDLPFTILADERSRQRIGHRIPPSILDFFGDRF